MDKKPLHPSAYERVLERLQQNLAEAELKSWDYLQERIEEAVEMELAAEELTRDELDLLTAYLKRDLKKLGYYAHETGAGLAAFLKFDLNILEQKLIDQLLDLADKTRLEHEELRERLAHADDEYIAGELALPGTLACLECGEHRVLEKTQRIEACERCGCQYFHRMMEPAT